MDAMACASPVWPRGHARAPRSVYLLSDCGGVVKAKQWATEAGLPARCRLHGLKKGGMRRLAKDGNTAHELMAISGHKTLTEVQRYTADADRKLLADKGMAKKRQGQTKNAGDTNVVPP